MSAISFRLHCTLAEIEQRIDAILYDVLSIDGDYNNALDNRIHAPLGEVFPDNPSRYRHSQSKRAYARGYAAGRLKSIKNQLKSTKKGE